MDTRNRVGLLALTLGLAAATGARAQAVAELEVLPPTVTLQVGQRQNVVATAYDARSNVLPSVRISWSSTNLAVARVDPDAREPGVATIVGVAPGIALIEAQAGGRKGTVQVQVGGAGGVPPAGQPGMPVAASSAVALRVDPNSVYLLPSEDVRLSVAFLQADGSPAAAMPITWRSLSETVASIGSDGTVVGISSGQGVVEARTATGLVARATVFVAAAPFAFGVDALSLAPSEQDTVPVVVPGQGGRRVATRLLTWTSTNPAVATVTPLGIAVGVSAGQAEIFASGFGQTARLPVVVHRAVEEMAVHPPPATTLTVPVGGTAAAGAEARASDGSPIPEAPFTWRMADTTVATYDVGAKLVRGKKIGRTRLTVVGPARGLEASWTVDVVAGGLGLTPSRLGLVPGERKSLSASFVNDRGESLGPATGVQFASLNPAVASVDNQGNITGASYGYARVVGTTAWGKADTVDVYVQGEIVVLSTRRGRMPTIFAFDRASPTRMIPLAQDTTATQADPAPAPDGSRIAYVTDRDGNAEIYVMNADGSNPRRLTNTPAAEGGPAWTPDGSKIVYTSNAAEGTTTATFHIWIMDADGSNPRQLTQGPHSDFQPAVSPDGGTVAFTTDRDRETNYNVYLMGIDGSNQRQFTRAPAPETNPVWVADGQLAYLMQEQGRTVTGRVMRANVSTGEAVPISPPGLAVSDFDLSKTADLLALVVTQYGRGSNVAQRLYLLPPNAAGTLPAEVPLASSQDRLTSPAFRK